MSGSGSSRRRSPSRTRYVSSATTTRINAFRLYGAAVLELGAELWAAAETSDDRTLHHLIASGVRLALIALLSQLDLPASPWLADQDESAQAAHSGRLSQRLARARAALLDRLQAAAASRPAPLVLAHVG